MLRLVRWLFLLGIITALVAFLLAYPLAGHTAASRVCHLAGSPACEALAARGGRLVRRWEARLRPAAPPAAARAALPRAPENRVAVAARAPAAARPLDRHTVAERRALDAILARRGSR